MATDNKSNEPPIRPAERRVKPIGDPLGWSSADVFNRSDVSESDKLEAITFWERHAPNSLRQLLRARKSGQ